MRTKSIPKAHSMDTKKKEELKIGFSFFNLPYPPFNSNLLTKHLEETLADWIPNRNFSLLYKATRDGFEPRSFHNTCDNKGPTIAIIKTEEGYLCGGYSPLPWTSQEGWSTHFGHFLFTLTNPQNIPPKIYTISYNYLSGNHKNGTEHIKFLVGMYKFEVKKRILCTPSHSLLGTWGHVSPFTGDTQARIEDIEVYSVTESA
jgi:hypothetical protein